MEARRGRAASARRRWELGKDLGMGTGLSTGRGGEGGGTAGAREGEGSPFDDEVGWKTRKEGVVAPFAFGCLSFFFPSFTLWFRPFCLVDLCIIFIHSYMSQLNAIVMRIKK